MNYRGPNLKTVSALAVFIFAVTLTECILRHYPDIRLKDLRKTTKNLSQDRRSPGRDLNPGPPEYEAVVLNTRPRLSVPYIYIFTLARYKNI
jgi:hypothetical protein